MRDLLVSVKMITYNHAPYIAKAIEGVLQQKTNFPFELVIGEDCSIDGTREIVFEYQKKHPNIIRVITSEKNVGMKKNGYRTAKACRGKYLAICEGDDFWHRPNKLQEQADYLEKHPECGLVYSSYDVYHTGKGVLIKDFVNHRKWMMPEKLSIYDFLENKDGRTRGILSCTVMVRRDLCEQIIESDPFIHQSDHFLMGDTQLFAEFVTRAEVHYIPKSFATYNLTEESATRSKDIRKELRFARSNAELLLYLCDKYNLPQHIRDKYEDYWCNSSLHLAFYTRDHRLADEVRRKKKAFTWKEWLRYLGTKNLTYRFVYQLSALVLNVFKKKYDPWI